MLDIVNRTIELSKDNWGALDSLGMKEQQGIAARIYRAWPALVKTAISRLYHRTSLAV